MNLSGTPFDFVIAFAGGVLWSFTPCVYPLLPVIIGYVGASSCVSRRRAFLLSFSYAGGTAFIYSLLGVLAGVYLNEYARDSWFTRIVNLAVMNLAGVPSIVHALFGVGAFVLFFVLWVVAPAKLGFGDVRLALLLGMFTAWIHPALPVYGLLFGSVLGLVGGGIALLARHDSRFPFGPALALGALAAVWWNEPILRGLTG